MSRFNRVTIVEDTRVDEAVAEGVTLERRSMLRVSAAAIAAAFALLPSCKSTPQKRSATVCGREPRPDGTLEVGELLAQMYPRALELIASGGVNEEAYLMGVSELMARLQIPGKDELKTTMQKFIDQHGGSRQSINVAIAMFAFEPGKGFQHHDHRDYNGVILGVEGEVRCRNFDILGDNSVPPKGETFQIRSTRDDVILPGRFSSLARNRDNVHEVVAGPEGGKVLDVFTFFNEDANSYFMEVDPKPRDAERGIFDAAWV